MFSVHEMRTLKTSERPYPTFSGTALRLLLVSAVDLAHPLCRVQPISCNQSRSPVYSPSHVCHSPPRPHAHCLAPTLSRSTRSHIVIVPLYLVLTLSHVLPHTGCHSHTWYLPLSMSHDSHHTVSRTSDCVACDRATHRPTIR